MSTQSICTPREHLLARRQFLGGFAAGVGAGIGGLCGLDVFAHPAAAEQLSKDQKRVLVVFLSGGVSQLESWDPKPNTDTGGPFRAIPTSATGVHISELLPMTARQMHRLTLIRSINTKEDDHGKGAYMMTTGRRQTPAAQFPNLGAVAAKALSPVDSPLPGHIHITPGGGGGRSSDSAYLGPKYSSIMLGNGQPPQYIARPGNITELADQQRNEFRKKANGHFSARRRTAFTDAYAYNYEQARKLMERKDTFDVSKEPAKDQERYGKHDFGRHCLLARRLLESGISFVQVSHTNYDTHNENFDFHIEQLGEFDGPFATLVGDLADRGMLESTLVIVMSEFGRTPRINHLYGRDHWSAAWSVLVGGAKIKPGAVIGKTNENGTAVAEREVDHGNLFHTYLQAVGLDSSGSFDIDGRAVPMADPASAPIKELVA